VSTNGARRYCYTRAVVVEAAAAVFIGSAASAWAVRGRSSGLFGANVWRGPSTRRAIALTFDDGPSESTPRLLELLAHANARATFFQCGANADRLPAFARESSGAGHEIGNHTYSHAKLYLKGSALVETEVARAQRALTEIHGNSPKWFRAPYGVRWFGMGTAMHSAGLTHAAWTTIARDWMPDARGVLQRCRNGSNPGAILCLHDGRELRVNPDIRVTLEAVGQLLPYLRDEGYELVTLSELLCPTK
jgi:peptidoglycan/xylan/chitin deacetylase (PgdA/CDA1 family)